MHQSTEFENLMNNLASNYKKPRTETSTGRPKAKYELVMKWKEGKKKQYTYRSDETFALFQTRKDLLFNDKKMTNELQALIKQMAIKFDCAKEIKIFKNYASHLENVLYLHNENGTQTNKLMEELALIESEKRN